MRYGLAAGDSLVMRFSLKVRCVGGELFARCKSRGRGHGAGKMSGRISLGPLFDDHWRSHLNSGAFAGGAGNVDLALRLVDALAHAGNSDAEKRISAVAVRGQRHADAVVADGKAYLRGRVRSMEIATARALEWRCTLASDSCATQNRVSSTSLGRRWKLSGMAKSTATPLRSEKSRK